MTFAEGIKNLSEEIYYELANYAIMAIKNHSSSYDEAVCLFPLHYYVSLGFCSSRGRI